MHDLTPHTARPGRTLGGLRGLLGTGLIAVVGTALADGAAAQTQLLNVSYDPTREFYREFNEAFNAHWQAEGNAALDIQTSHGGSGSQARAVIDGLEAQVVTLALAGDVDSIASKSGKIPADWQSKLPHNSAPYTSTVVFVVREGNPEGIENWDDLVADGVQVITANPKTSGGARWNYLAAWAYADKAFGGDEAKIREFVGKLYQNVPVLDTGARGSTTTFAQRGIGDVLLAWENEAFLAVEELGEDQFDIVRPSISILAEPTVALVPGNITSDEQGAAAQAYLDYLYSPEGQALALKHFFRAWDTSAADPADVERFPELELVSIADFGGWAEVQPAHFGDGGIFDQILRAEVSTARPIGFRVASPLPGFGLSLGILMTMLSVVVLIPIGALILRGAEIGPAGIWQVVSDERVRAALTLSFSLSVYAALFNLVFGLALAWVLARYRFPGRRIVDAAVDLPFALPTAVAGISLTALYAPNGVFGQLLAPLGIQVAYTPLGIWMALVFVGLPFVVRTVQPVIDEIERELEEASATLGASRARTLRRVILPMLTPALLTGFALALARSVGEYGSVIFIAGNLPGVTEIAPLLIVIRLEEFDHDGAVAIALAMLSISFLMLLAINLIQVWSRRRFGDA